MSATQTRVPWTMAARIAESLAEILRPACVRLEIAGSIRRVRETVGDIDLLCEPKLSPLTDMFDDPIGEDIDELHDLLCRLELDGTVTKRLNKNGQPSWGKSLKRAVYRDLAVDIRSCTDRDSWGFWLLISTGPAPFNKALVTPKWQGGLLPSGMEIKDGFCLYRSGGRIPTPTEHDVFNAFGLPYIEPISRDAAPPAAAERGGTG